MTLKQADADQLIKETASTNSILVGGQAVGFWAQYFGIPPELPALTSDVDYLATAAEAKRAAARLSFDAKLSIATLDDATPNTAVLSIDLDGYDEPIIIDYLAQIIGPESKQVVDTSILVEFEGSQIRVIHPLLLLQSKIANIHRLESKRGKEAIEQARLAIAIAAAFVDSMVKNQASQRDILRAVQSIAKYAATEPARFVSDQFALQCFDAISASALVPGVLPDNFHERQLPRLKAALGRRKRRDAATSKLVRP